ncbi:hypothetical protein GLA29479_1310 [Lysobacter antibioticus]|uniref:hypothetical protein n=1 Tax=Lysobacter antibioticus TaxID=84531 RepID=UPI000716E934|nr:hypothetical protein [Lysobacter antibioticus]ALN62194.1 hypothetical protein GLA29479_1310 [Lysobacter antibioticus]
MRRLTVPFACSLLLAASPFVHAKNACMIEGQVLGQIINECTETDPPASEDAPKPQCNSSLPGLAEIGGQVSARPVEACPSGAVAICDSPMNAKARIYYYKRNAAQIAAIKQACEMQRGQWVKP